MNETRKSHTGWNIFAGVMLMILGLIALGAQVFTGYATVLFFGWMLIIGGLVQVIQGFFSPGERTKSFVGGGLTLLVGGLIAANPTFTAATVTLLVSLLLMVTGLYYVIASLVVRSRNWGWALTGGLFTLLLGVVILTGWPVTGVTAIGFFVGLAFFTNGFFMVVNAFESAEVEEVSVGRAPTMAGVKGGGAKKEKEKEEEKMTKEKMEMDKESDDTRN